MQFLGRAAAHAAESANNEMILQFVDHAFIPPLVEDLSEFHLDDALRHGADSDEDDGDTEGDQECVEHAPAVAERMDLAIAHRGHGGERHVEGVERGPAFDQRETGGPHQQHQRNGDGDKEEAALETVHGGRSRKLV